MLREVGALIPSQSSFRMANHWFSFHIRRKAGLPKRLTKTNEQTRYIILLWAFPMIRPEWVGISCLQLFWQGMDVFFWLSNMIDCMWLLLYVTQTSGSECQAITHKPLNSALLMRPILMLYGSSPFVCHAPKRIWETGRAVLSRKTMVFLEDTSDCRMQDRTGVGDK